MSVAWKLRRSGIVALAVFTALGLVATRIGGIAAGQSSQEAAGVRLMKGAIDLHFHMEAPVRSSPSEAAPAQVKSAKARGLRGLVLKSHNEPTQILAYHLRKEIPGIELFAGVVMNLTNGGMNPAAVEYMATRNGGLEGRIVWMPAGDTEKEVRLGNNPNGPFVAVTKGGQLLPETKAVIATIAKHPSLVLASGHIQGPEALLVFAEARRLGVKHLIATHAMDEYSGKDRGTTGHMTVPQIQEAVKLGAIVEFDYRNLFEENFARLDAIRTIGPEHCFISEFWTKGPGREYAEPVQVGAWVAEMKKHGFTDHELDIMVKENPARLMDLSVE